MRIAWSRSTVVICLTALALLLVGFSLSALQAHGRALPPAPAAAQQEGQVWMSIQPTQSVVALGETFTVAVVIQDAPEIYGYGFDMAWDPSVFSVTSVADAGFLGAGTLFLEDFDNDEGDLTAGAFILPPLPDELPSGHGTLAIITLQATGVGTSPLDLYATYVFTRGGQLVIPDPGDGTAESICDVAHIVQLAGDSPVELGQPTNFTATVTGAQPITYTWDFGDGSPAVVGLGLDATTHTYTEAGTYTATLTVDNVCGVEDTAAVTVTVDEVCESVAILELTSDGPVTLGEPVHLTATVTGAEPITYTWDLGDGSPTRVGVGLEAITHTYAAAGTYTATLMVANDCPSQDAALLPVAVVECQDVVITDLTADGPGELGDPVHFTATVAGTQPITYTWDLGDGSPALVGVGLDAITHTYAAAGIYTATLTVENDCPSQAAAAITVTVEELCDDVAITSLVHESPVTIGESVRFTATVTGTLPITYTWAFGDGSPPLVGLGLDTVTHVYTATGTVTATLTVANPCSVASDSVGFLVEPRRIFLPLVLRQGG